MQSTTFQQFPMKLALDLPILQNSRYSSNNSKVNLNNMLNNNSKTASKLLSPSNNMMAAANMTATTAMTLKKLH